MSKTFLTKLLLSLYLLATSVLWLLSNLVPETFGFFDAYWAVGLVSAGFGVVFLLKGIFKKGLVTIKWFFIALGAAFLVVALFAMFATLQLPNEFLKYIIAVIAASALVLGVIGTGGKKWDSGDNQKVGYKNYHQRKAEEEKQAKKDN